MCTAGRQRTSGIARALRRALPQSRLQADLHCSVLILLCWFHPVPSSCSQFGLCRLRRVVRMLRCKACLLSPGQKGLMGLFERGLLLQNMPWPAGDFSDSEREAKRQRARTCDVPATFLCISAKIADANGFATLTEDSVSTGRNGPLAA